MGDGVHIAGSVSCTLKEFLCCYRRHVLASCDRVVEEGQRAHEGRNDHFAAGVRRVEVFVLAQAFGDSVIRVLHIEEPTRVELM